MMLANLVSLISFSAPAHSPRYVIDKTAIQAAIQILADLKVYSGSSLFLNLQKFALNDFLMSFMPIRKS
jgi:hypothetical protein